MLKPRNNVIAPDNEGEFQRADIDAPGRRRGQQLAVIVQHECRIDARPVIVVKADDQEQRGRQREQHHQDQRKRTNLQPRDQPGRQPRGSPPARTCCLPPTQGERQNRAQSRGIHAAILVSLRDRISGMMRVPNCSMPMMKSSNVIITPRTPGTAASSSSIRATEA